MTRLGNTTKEAREIILASLQTISQKYHNDEINFSNDLNCNNDNKSQVPNRYPWLDIIMIIIIIILLSISVSNSHIDEYPGLLLSIAIILFMVVFNSILHKVYLNSSKDELIHAIDNIILEYNRFINNNSTWLEAQSNFTNYSNESMPPSGHKYDSEIKSGHAQISIVPCYRNHKWCRIPTLLLADGDIIALQCGDLTPARCVELSHHEYMAAVSAASTTAPTTTTPTPTVADNIKTNTYTPPNQTNQVISEKGTKLLKSNSDPLHMSNHHPTATSTNYPFTPPPSGQNYDPSLILSYDAQTATIPLTLSAIHTTTNTTTHTNTNTTTNNIQTTVHTTNTTDNTTIHTTTPKKKYSYQRHKSVHADATELLELSADMRCFRILTTPIYTFIYDIIIQYKKEHNNKRYPLLRLLFYNIIKYSYYILFATILLLLICSIIKFILIPNTVVYYNNIILIPVVSTIICYLPLFLPFFVLLAESMMTANLLSTIEIILLPTNDSESEILYKFKRHSQRQLQQQHQQHRKSTASILEVNKSHATNTTHYNMHNMKHKHSPEQPSTTSHINSSSNQHMSKECIQSHSLDDDNDNDCEVGVPGGGGRGSGNIHPGEGSARASGVATNMCVAPNMNGGSDEGGGVGRGGVDDVSSDEFNDDDIDERAEEIADEISTRVLWTRLLHYIITIFLHRLGLHTLKTRYQQWFKLTSMLPIPHAKCRLFEFLGGITMVCFIDDDVICESYSVTEEIFLLKHTDTLHTHATSPSPRPSQPASSLPGSPRVGNDTVAGYTTSAEQGVSGGGSGGVGSGGGGDGSLTQAPIDPGSLNHGVILDLHPNAELTGSRFEDPNW